MPRTSTAELPIEDGSVSARTLPIDKASAEIDYDTITFGLG